LYISRPCQVSWPIFTRATLC